MSAHITGKLITCGEYAEEDRVDGEVPLARAVIVMPQSTLRYAERLPIHEEVAVIATAELASLRAQLAEQEQAIQERGIALADAGREIDGLRAAIAAMPSCRCERSLDQQCELSMRLEKAERERDDAINVIGQTRAASTYAMDEIRAALGVSSGAEDKSSKRAVDYVREIVADKAALRSVVSSAVELLSADPTWDAAMAVVAQARAAMEENP